MSRCKAVVCGIIPPHILRHIAEHGDEKQRRHAQLALELSAATRGERQATSLAAMLPVSIAQKRRSIYDARQGHVLPGKLVRREGDPSTTDRTVNEAYDGAGKTHDFFSAVYGRNSIDDRGMRLDSTVHYGKKYANALWNGRQMIYGDGDGELFQRFTASLEVIAHELTHGVTQYSANLEYRDQPGALNEHFSDVFGVLVKQYTRKQTASKADWLVGAQLFTRRVRGDAVRSMKAPGTAYDDPVLGKDPQPATMRDYVETEFDNGGVHINSGIPNHAFYRVATLLEGKAWETAGEIWYRALTRKLRTEASFADCAEATFEAARELFGAGSEPQRAVIEGWEAVGIPIAHDRIDDRRRMPISRLASIDVAGGGAEVPSSYALPRRT